MSAQLATKIQTIFDLYFAPPAAAPKYTSVLHLARRDAAQCFGYDPNSYDVSKGQKPTEDGRQVLWPGAMTTFAATDLLGKFFAGTDSEQTPAGTTVADQWRYSAGGRFKKFIEKYITASPDEIETMYQLRCALDHSFALWAQKRNNNKVYSFTLSRTNAKLIETRINGSGDIEAIIYLYNLHTSFEQAVVAFETDYRKQLVSSTTDQKVFEELVDKYGFIGIATASTFGW